MVTCDHLVARALNVLRTHYIPNQRAMFAAERANTTLADTVSFCRSTELDLDGGNPHREQCDESPFSAAS